MTPPHHESDRTIGLAGATGIGVGAIVGGGILALAGVAFSITGPGALLAFGLNGVIAMLTALSFAAMATRFPESGGTYAFARRVFSIEAAFIVGWVVWFASIVAAVLYAAGFAAFATAMWTHFVAATPWAEPAWLSGRPAFVTLAVGAPIAFAALLSRRTGGGQWINVVKVVVFGILIFGGLWAIARAPAGTVRDGMQPLLPGGGRGLLAAMGFTFIALQGFDLIATVAGEVRDPRRNLPRSMVLSLAIALAIYLPLLLIIATVGTAAGQPIAELAAEDPEEVVAKAALNFLGPTGYWMVLVVGVLSMLSALQANLLAASRVALAMARDRTLPRVLDRVHTERRIPVPAIVATTALVVVIVVAVPDVATAGSAASLIFLVTFALAHAIVLLARFRVGVAPGAFRVPLFPALPIVGAVGCLGLAAFQGVVEPFAGLITIAWIGLGGVVFLAVFARRARVRDASAEALDPDLVRLRGRSPLVLVPVANPASAAALVTVAGAITPPGIGRVLLLSVIRAEGRMDPAAIAPPLGAAQAVLREALGTSLGRGLTPEMLTTIASHPWPEIARVARTYRCESLLLGMSDPGDDLGGSAIGHVIRAAGCDAVVLRAPTGWDVSSAARVLIPVGGRGGHDVLRARLVGHLRRTGDRVIRYVQVLPGEVDDDHERRAVRALRRVAAEEAAGQGEVSVLGGDDAAAVVIREAAQSDLIVLGVHRTGRHRRSLGAFVQRIARETDVPLIVISRGAS